MMSRRTLCRFQWPPLALLHSVRLRSGLSFDASTFPMTTVEELVDEIRRHFSPDEFLDISKSAPLAAKLRLLSYQLSDGLVKPADMEANKEEYALDWHAVESEKFSKKPSAFSHNLDPALFTDSSQPATAKTRIPNMLSMRLGIRSKRGVSVSVR